MPVPSGPRLAADLSRLRERYLAAFPRAGRRVALLALVPVALRHLLALQLDLRQAENLPNRYSDLAVTSLGPDRPPGDAVERRVVAYAHAMRAADQPAIRAARHALGSYFTEPQIVELTLVVSMACAMAMFDAALDDLGR